MGIVAHPKPAPAVRVATNVSFRPARTFIEGIRALASGFAAAADLRRLSAMNEGQLDALDLTRDGIPEELFNRHFAT